MNSSIRNIQLVAVIVVLVSTIIAFFLEMKEMYENKDITLADLLLMFIYIEVIGLVRSYWETQSCKDNISFNHSYYSASSVHNITR